jgi:2-polyprenyl-3-methyl-5-hydroxy-6-metoxy-1,4-benzoquinol methylase
MSNYEKILEFWNQRARDHKTAPTASMGDVLLMDREVDTAQSYIPEGSRVLDVGCANGYSTLRLARIKKVEIDAFDYSAEMVHHAQTALEAQKSTLKSPVKFWVQDVLKFKPTTETYDVIIAIRCIINLPTLAQQLEALDNLWLGLKPNGKLILSDATKQGWDQLNALRSRFKLKETPMPWHNLYLDIEAINNHFQGRSKHIHVDHFASTYYWGTRFLRPAILGEYKTANYSSLFNKIFIRFPNLGSFGIQKIMIYTK